jgi:hypothetical protein
MSQNPAHQQVETAHLAGQNFYPKLLEQLNMVDHIQIKTADSQVRLEKTGDVWGLPAKNGYAADDKEVAKVLNGIASLTIEAAKTKSSKNHSKLHLEDIATNAKSTQITLKQGDKVVADLMVGKSKASNMDASSSAIYVRKAGDAQTWQVLGKLSPNSQLDAWLNKSISDIKAARVREVQLTQADKAAVRIFKNAADDTQYQLADQPADTELEGAYRLNSLASSLDSLDFEDVVLLDSIAFPDTANAAVFTTFDGLQITLRSVESNGKHYVKYNAAAKASLAVTSNAAASETDDATAAIVETVEARDLRISQEANTLNAQLGAWAFVLSSQDTDNFSLTFEDLFKAKVDEVDTSNEDAVAHPSSTANTALPNIQGAEAFAEMLKQAAEKSKNNPNAATAPSLPSGAGSEAFAAMLKKAMAEAGQKKQQAEVNPRAVIDSLGR